MRSEKFRRTGEGKRAGLDKVKPPFNVMCSFIILMASFTWHD